MPTEPFARHQLYPGVPRGQFLPPDNAKRLNDLTDEAAEGISRCRPGELELLIADPDSRVASRPKESANLSKVEHLVLTADLLAPRSHPPRRIGDAMMSLAPRATGATEGELTAADLRFEIDLTSGGVRLPI